MPGTGPNPGSRILLRCFTVRGANLVRPTQRDMYAEEAGLRAGPDKHVPVRQSGVRVLGRPRSRERFLRHLEAHHVKRLVDDLPSRGETHCGRERFADGGEADGLAARTCIGIVAHACDMEREPNAVTG